MQLYLAMNFLSVLKQPLQRHVSESVQLLVGNKGVAEVLHDLV
jgi:hypothetical protein